MSIRYKILLMLLVLAFATHAIVTTIYYHNSQKIVKSLAQYHLTSMANVQQQRMTTLIKANYDKLKLISSRTQMRSSLKRYLERGDKADLILIKKILNDATSQSDTISDIFILDIYGNVVSSSSGHKEHLSFQEHKLFSEGLHHASVSMLFSRQEYAVPSFIFSSPLLQQGEILGVVAMQVNMDRLNDFMRDYSGLGKTGEVMMATETQQGNILFFTPLRFESFPQLFKQTDDMSELMTNELRDGADELTLAKDYRGKAVLYISRYMPELDLAIIVKMDREEVLSINEELKQLIIYLIFFLLIVVLVASLVMSHKITRPVINLTEVAVMISQGHLEKRIHHYTDDELGRLGKALNTMADRLINTNLILEEKVLEKTSELRAVNAKLELIAETDALTGLKNRGYLDKQAEIEWHRNMRHETFISFLLIDIDFFKRVNDNMGHQAGDNYLKAVAGSLKKTMKRAEDIVARYGGEEFIIVLGSTNQDEATIVAELLRDNIAALKLKNPYSGVSDFLTVSIGIHSLIPKQGDSVIEAIDKADKALYQAKESGRDQARIFSNE